MTHLNETEFIDRIDGALEPSRAAHFESCPACRAQVETLSAALADVDVDPGHEPSPLFWEMFPSRVTAAIREADVDDERPRAAWWLGRPGLAALACAAVLVIAVITGFSLRHWSEPTPVDPVAANASDSEPSLDDDIEQDAAWAVVRTAADDLQYDDALAEGISARPGASEGVAMEFSDAERAELVRLIEREIKRTGA